MAEKPHIEELLARAHQSFSTLVTVRQRVAAAGIDPAQLPDDSELRAFALLGERNGDECRSRLAHLLPTLIAKALAADGPQSAPVARFWLAIEHLLDGILNVEERFAVRLATGSAESGPIIRCPPVVRATWGQTIRMTLGLPDDIEWLLVRPDVVFGLGQTLHQVDARKQPMIWFDLPCDTGTVLVAAMSRSGELSRQEIRVEVDNG